MGSYYKNIEISGALKDHLKYGHAMKPDHRNHILFNFHFAVFLCVRAFIWGVVLNQTKDFPQCTQGVG